MKLKMIKAPRISQTDMVCHTAYGTFVAELDQVMELSEEAGNAILGKWPGCFQQVFAKAASTKMVAPSKMSVEEEAASEATKMAHGYQNKKA